MWFNEEKLDFILKKSRSLESSLVLAQSDFLYLVKFVWKKKNFKNVSNSFLARNLLETSGILQDLKNYLQVNNILMFVLYSNFKWYVRQSLYLKELFFLNFNLNSYGLKKNILKIKNVKVNNYLIILKKKNIILLKFIKFFNYKFLLYLDYFRLIDNQILLIEEYFNFLEKNYIFTKFYIFHLKFNLLSTFKLILLKRFIRSFGFSIEKRIVEVPFLKRTIDLDFFLDKVNYDFINWLPLKKIYTFWKNNILRKRNDTHRYFYLLFYKLFLNLKHSIYIKKRYFFYLKNFLLLNNLKNTTFDNTSDFVKKRKILYFLLKNLLFKRSKDKFDYKIIQYTDYINSNILSKNKNIILNNIYIYYFENFLKEEYIIDNSYLKKLSLKFYKNLIKIFKLLFVLFLKLNKNFKIKFKRKIYKFIYTYFYFLILNDCKFIKLSDSLIKETYFFFNWTDVFYLKFFSLISQNTINSLNLVINYRFDFLYKTMFIIYQSYWKKKWNNLNLKLKNKERLFLKKNLYLKNFNRTNFYVLNQLYDLYRFDNYKYLTVSNKNLFLKLKLKYLNYFISFSNTIKKKKFKLKYNIDFLLYFKSILNFKNIKDFVKLNIKWIYNLDLKKFNKIYKYLIYTKYLLNLKKKVSLTKFHFKNIAYFYLLEDLIKDTKQFLYYFIFNVRSLFFYLYLDKLKILNYFNIKSLNLFNLSIFKLGFFYKKIYKKNKVFKDKELLIEKNLNNLNCINNDFVEKFFINFSKVLFFNSIFFFSDKFYIFNFIHDLKLESKLTHYSKIVSINFNFENLFESIDTIKNTYLHEKIFLINERLHILQFFKDYSLVINDNLDPYLVFTEFYLKTYESFFTLKKNSLYFKNTYIKKDTMERILRRVFKLKRLQRMKFLLKNIFFKWKKRIGYKYNNNKFYKLIRKYYELKDKFINLPDTSLDKDTLLKNWTNILFNFEFVNTNKKKFKSSVFSFIYLLFNLNIIFLKNYFYYLREDLNLLLKFNNKLRRMAFILYNKLIRFDNKINQYKEKNKILNKNLEYNFIFKKLKGLNFYLTNKIDNFFICKNCYVVSLTIFQKKNLLNVLNNLSLNNKFYIENFQLKFCSICNKFQLQYKELPLKSFDNFKMFYKYFLEKSFILSGYFLIKDKLYYFSKRKNFRFMFKFAYFLVLKNKKINYNLLYIFNLGLKDKFKYNFNTLKWFNIAFFFIVKKNKKFFRKFGYVVYKTLEKANWAKESFERRKDVLFKHLDVYLANVREATKKKRALLMKESINLWRERKAHVLRWEKLKRIERTKNFLVFLYSTIEIVKEKDEIELIGDFETIKGVEFVKWTRRRNPYLKYEYLGDFNPDIHNASDFAINYVEEYDRNSPKKFKLLDYTDYSLNLKKHKNVYELMWEPEKVEKPKEIDDSDKHFYRNLPGEPLHPYWTGEEE